MEGEEDLGEGKALLDHALGIAIQAQLEKVTWARGRPRPQASTALPAQELSASHEPGCVGGCSLGAWPGILSLCLMDKALPAEWFGWEWAAPALGAERPEGSAPKPGLDGPESALLGHIGIPLPLAEPWVSLPCLVHNWIDFLL